MSNREELDKLLQDTTKGRTKQVAFKLDCHTNTVDREMNGSVKYNCLEKTIAFMDGTKGDEIVQKLCATQGGVFVVVPDIKPGGEAVAISNMVKEFGELLSEIGESKSDGKIDKSEVVRMRKELTDFIAVAEAFLICAERGDYDEK